MYMCLYSKLHPFEYVPPSNSSQTYYIQIQGGVESHSMSIHVHYASLYTRFEYLYPNYIVALIVSIPDCVWEEVWDVVVTYMDLHR